MKIVAKNADHGNSFPLHCLDNKQNPVRITGYDFTHVIELSPLPKSLTRVLKFACNLACSTSRFEIIKSLSTLAEEAGVSISTVQRAYRLAVKLGILTHEEQRCKNNHKWSKPSKYTFTSKALAFVQASLAELKAANLQPAGRQSLVRKIVADTFSKLNFTLATPGQNEQATPGQNDQQEVRDLSRTRETQYSESAISESKEIASEPSAPEKKFGIYQESLQSLAAGSAAADKERRAEAYQRNGQLMHKVYGYIKSTFKPKAAAGRKPESRRQTGDFAGDGLKHDNYAIPEGFRGA